jgi:hypothetical protein
LPFGRSRKGWALYVSYTLCGVNFIGWMKGKKSMSFAISMLQHEPTSQLEDAVLGFLRSSKNKIFKHSVRFRILTVVSMRMTVFWDVMLCCLVEAYRLFRRCLLLPSSSP